MDKTIDDLLKIYDNNEIKHTFSSVDRSFFEEEKKGDLDVVYNEIFIHRTYDHQKFCCVSPGDIVVDIGANIGVFSKYAELMGAGIVFSFEPVSDNFKLLKKNKTNICRAFNLAVSNKVKIDSININKCCGGHSLVGGRREDIVGTEAVGCITVNNIIKDMTPYIDFLKIDTEGSELDIINGIDEDNLYRIKKIAMEYHHCHFGYDIDTRGNLIKKLVGAGFNFHILFYKNDDNTQMIYFWR